MRKKIRFLSIVAAVLMIAPSFGCADFWNSSSENGGLEGSDIKEKHQQIFEQQVELLIVDETHFGARAEKYGAVLRDVKDVKEKTSEEEFFLTIFSSSRHFIDTS